MFICSHTQIIKCSHTHIYSFTLSDMYRWTSIIISFHHVCHHPHQRSSVIYHRTSSSVASPWTRPMMPSSVMSADVLKHIASFADQRSRVIFMRCIMQQRSAPTTVINQPPIQHSHQTHVDRYEHSMQHSRHHRYGPHQPSHSVRTQPHPSNRTLRTDSSLLQVILNFRRAHHPTQTIRMLLRHHRFPHILHRNDTRHTLISLTSTTQTQTAPFKLESSHFQTLCNMSFSSLTHIDLNEQEKLLRMWTTVYHVYQQPLAWCTSHRSIKNSTLTHTLCNPIFLQHHESRCRVHFENKQITHITWSRSLYSHYRYDSVWATTSQIQHDS